MLRHNPFFRQIDIRHISRAENCRANNLTQDALGYRIKKGRFQNFENSIINIAPSSQVADRPGYIAGQSAVGSDYLSKEFRPFDGT